MKLKFDLHQGLRWSNSKKQGEVKKVKSGQKLSEYKRGVISNRKEYVNKKYCGVCGQELTEIRGRYPKEPRRKVCACCATEKLEWIEEQKNIGTAKSNYT